MAGKITSKEIDELVVLAERARQAQAALAEALAATATKRDLSRAALGRYVRAKAANRVEKLVAELEAVEQLSLFDKRPDKAA
jgi:hypothetical protein